MSTTTLRLIDGLLEKSGCPVIPPSKRKSDVTEMHIDIHFGMDKVYQLLKDRYYWPNMYNYQKAFSKGCGTFQKKPNAIPHLPKLPWYLCKYPKLPCN